MPRRRAPCARGGCARSTRRRGCGSGPRPPTSPGAGSGCSTCSGVDMSWDPEAGGLRRGTRRAHERGGEERVARQHASGRLTVRERIERLFDEGTFHETGALAGKGTYGDDGEIDAFLPANMVVGQGRIAGRRAVVQGDDFTVRGGAADAAIWQKMVWAERLAHDLRMPLVRLVDGTGGGGSVRSLEDMGYTYVPAVPGFDLMGANLSCVPVVAAALGPCAGLGAARVVASHFSVIARGAQVFVAGPPVVAMAGLGEAPDKEQLGGARTQTAAGAVDNEAADEDDALAQIKRFLSYLPDNAWETAPVAATTDPVDRREESLLGIVPRDARKPYKMGAILEAVVDRASLFEVGARYGRSLITALARLDGRSVGVLASAPRPYAGGLTGVASRTRARLVHAFDQFRLPVANFVDQPGFVIGSAAERAGTIRRGTRALVGVYQATVPWCSVLVRKVYGVAGAGHGNHAALNQRYAWPSGDWGSLPIAGGLEAAYRRELEAAEDPEAKRREIEARLNAVRSPFRTAERFNIEEIIDPRDTRPLLCDWAARAYEILAHELGDGPKTRGLRP